VAQPNVSVVTATEPRCRSIRRGRAAVLRLLP